MLGVRHSLSANLPGRQPAEGSLLPLPGRIPNKPRPADGQRRGGSGVHRRGAMAQGEADREASRGVGKLHIGARVRSRKLRLHATGIPRLDMARRRIGQSPARKAGSAATVNHLTSKPSTTSTGSDISGNEGHLRGKRAHFAPVKETKHARLNDIRVKLGSRVAQHMSRAAMSVSNPDRSPVGIKG